MKSKKLCRVFHRICSKKWFKCLLNPRLSVGQKLKFLHTFMEVFWVIFGLQLQKETKTFFYVFSNSLCFTYLISHNFFQVVNAYKRLIKDITILMGVTSSEALKFSTDIFFYEKRIAEITPDSQFQQDPVKTYNPITVSELKITAASVSIQADNCLKPNSNLWLSH